MTSKTPPIPPADRSNKGPGGPVHGDIGEPSIEPQINPDKQGQQSNSKINTTNQGLQQDR